jgi:hypothetical protein
VSVDSRKLAAFAALAKQHDIHLRQQPDDVRTALASDFQAAGVPVNPETFAIQFTDGVQVDNALEVLKRHGLLPADATLSY